MKRNINTSLENEVRGVGKRTTPEDLKKRGVRNIRSVSMEQLSRLIERSVSEILRERGYLFSAQEITSIQEESAQKVHDALEIERNLTSRQKDLEQTRKQFQQELASIPGPSSTTANTDDDLLERRIRKVLTFIEETQAAVHQALEYVKDRKRPSYQPPGGLDTKAPDHQQRAKLMEGVFKSNRGTRDDA